MPVFLFSLAGVKRGGGLDFFGTQSLDGPEHFRIGRRHAAIAELQDIHFQIFSPLAVEIQRLAIVGGTCVTMAAGAAPGCILSELHQVGVELLRHGCPGLLGVVRRQRADLLN